MDTYYVSKRDLTFLFNNIIVLYKCSLLFIINMINHDVNRKRDIGVLN